MLCKLFYEVHEPLTYDVKLKPLLNINVSRVCINRYEALSDLFPSKVN